MRLFIAINFPDALKDNLASLNQAVKAGAASGSFTERDNFHLTLAFIGESNAVTALTAILEGLPKYAFDITLGGAGSFKREHGELLWIGVAPSSDLTALERLLRNKLRTAKFPVEDRPFRPHVTLCRGFEPRHRFEAARLLALFPSTTLRVHRISLMKSERKKGKLVYTELYGAELE